MTPEQYTRSKQIFLELCEKDRELRGEELAKLSDPVVAEEVSSLLDYYEETPADELRPDSEEPQVGLSSGELVSGRYRVVALLGKGGMGEVYRADDLVLGGQVALKFLRVRAHARHMWNEARLARQVTHPNVCRVFDMGEVDGRPFITMEYVDGEHLGSLLNRIGRLPKDRTVFLARQLFSGLAAAHAKGVLHRDLKPANIMIDGRGDVRITDFGIASRERAPDASDLQAGTPAYMAPEQLAGLEVTARSDLYSMGLVLYEMCTGVYPFEADGFQEYARAHAEQTPSPPSAEIDDMDPTLERVILKCLEKNPRERPSSALAVAAALPGGDPLSLAVSIGETPSPEMVAEAGSRGVLEKRSARWLLGSIAAMLLVFLGFSDRAKRFDTVDLALPPEVLAEKARERLRAFGWSVESGDEAWGFLENHWALEEVPAGGGSPIDTTAPGSSPILFWYRYSPWPMVPGGLENLTIFGATIGPYDPPVLDPGSALVLLHPQGTLDHMEVQPSYDPESETAAPAADEAAGTGSEAGSAAGPRGPPGTDFEAVSRAAGLDPARLSPRPAHFPPPFFADERVAFSGSSALRPELELEIRMAGYRGRPVYFRMAPKIEATGSEAEASLFESLISDWRDLWVVIQFAALLAALPLMRRNLRRGRGDRRGARRLAFVVFATFGLLWILNSPHFRDLGTEWNMAQVRLGQALASAAMAWVFYLALEPYVRRIWPRTLISWTRLFYGRYHDPFVGRSVLIGVAVGAAWALIGQLDQLLPRWLGLAHVPHPLDWQQFDYALGVSSSLAGLVQLAYGALFDSVFSLLLLVLLRLLLGRRSYAVFAYIALVTVMYSHEGVHPHISWLTMGLSFAAIEALVLVRFGLVTYASGTFVYTLLAYYPITLDISVWYAKTGFFAIATVMLFGSLSAYFALAPRRAGSTRSDPISRRTSSRTGESLSG